MQLSLLFEYGFSCLTLCPCKNGETQIRYVLTLHDNDDNLLDRKRGSQSTTADKEFFVTIN